MNRNKHSNQPKLKPITGRTQGTTTQRQAMAKQAEGKKLSNLLHCQIQHLSPTGIHSWGFPHFRLQPQPSTVAAGQLDHLFKWEETSRELKAFHSSLLIQRAMPVRQAMRQTSCQLSHQSTITLTFVFVQHLWNFPTPFVGLFFLCFSGFGLPTCNVPRLAEVLWSVVGLMLENRSKAMDFPTSYVVGHCPVINSSQSGWSNWHCSSWLKTAD